MNKRATPETDAPRSGFSQTRELTSEEWFALYEKTKRERDEARVERDALRDAVNALHDYVHGKRNDDKDISEILNGAMKI